jgi:hypothetical protein
VAHGPPDRYACAIDACRGHAVALAALAVMRELDCVKKAWLELLVEAAEGSDGRCGHMAVALTQISKACLELLIDQAIDKCVIARDRCDPYCRRVSLDFDKPLYEVVMRSRSALIGELLGSSDWLAVVDVEGNAKKVCVLDK